MTAPLCDERSSEGSARALQLSDIDAAAKVYASSYASPHHITFTVAGLRNLIASLASPSPQLSSLSGWNSVDERMPEPGTVCLVAGPKHWFDDKPFVQIDTWQEQHEAPVSFSSATVPVGLGWDGGFDWIGRVGYTHWMPLPPPPQS